MYKFIFRSIIATLLSVTLITQSVVAQTQTYNSDGTVTTTQPKEFVGAKNNKSWMASAVMGSMAMVAVMFNKYKYTTDILLGIAGGVAYLIGEMSSTQDVNSITMNITTRSAGAQDETQLANLNKLKSTTDEALKGVKQKYQFQQIATYAFGLAAVAVAWNSLMLEMARTTLKTSQEAATTAAAAVFCPATIVGKTFPEQMDIVRQAKSVLTRETIPNTSLTCQANYAAEISLDNSLLISNNTLFLTESETCMTAAQLADDASDATSGGSFTFAAAEGLAALKAAKAAVAANKKALEAAEAALYAYGTPVVTGTNSIPIKKQNILEILFGVLVPEATAGSSDKTGALLWGAGGMAIGWGLAQSLAVTADLKTYTPNWRILLWAAFALIINEAANATQDTINALQRQSDNIAAIIAAMTNTGAPTGHPGAGPGSGPIMPPGGLNAPPPLDVSPQGGDKTFPCAIPSTTGKGCGSIAGVFSNNPMATSLPPDVGGAAMGLLTNMDKALASKSIGPDAFGNAAQRTANMTAMNNMLGKARDALNSQLTKMGKPTIDFNNAGKDLAKQFMGIGQDTFNKGGSGSGGGFMGSHGGSGNGSTTPATGAGNGSGFAASGAGKMAGKGAGVAGGSASSGGIKIPNFNLKADDTGSDPAAAVTAAPNTMDQFELSKNDINKDSGASLFQIISERYIKTGYPILFEEVPVKVPLAPPAEKK